jgi:hypothetical protein
VSIFLASTWDFQFADNPSLYYMLKLVISRISRGRFYRHVARMRLSALAACSQIRYGTSCSSSTYACVLRPCGRLIDPCGRLIDPCGRLIDPCGRMIDSIKETQTLEWRQEIVSLSIYSFFANHCGDQVLVGPFSRQANQSAAAGFPKRHQTQRQIETFCQNLLWLTWFERQRKKPP